MLAPFLSFLLVIVFRMHEVGFIPLPIYIIVPIEFFIYLFKSDEDFEKTYIQNKKGWL